LSSGQPEVRREEALLLRAGVEPHVWRSGGSLWRGHPSGAAVSSAGQGQGGSRGTDRSAVGAGGAAQAPVLQSGGVNEAILELVHKLNERPFRKLAGSPFRAVSEYRSPCVAAVASTAVRVCGVEEGAGESGLSHRVWAGTTKHAVSTGGQGGRGAEHARDGGDLPSRQAGCQPLCAAVSRMWPAPMRRTALNTHQQYLEWTPTRIIEWAGQGWPLTARLVESILTSKPHPEMGYRSALGVIRLERK